MLDATNNNNNKQVGDLNSNKAGSAARFNAGKPPMGLIPFGIMANLMSDLLKPDYRDAWMSVGRFQLGGPVDDLYEALMQLNTDWVDCANVFDYGRNKYAAHNWCKGFQWSVVLDCIGRHFQKIALGEANDAESGLPHKGHIECNIVMLIFFSEMYPEGDDRFKGVEK